MTTATAPSVLDSLVEDLRDAQVRLADARLAFEHSPNGDRLSWLQASRSHADALLDIYLTVTKEN